MNVRDKYRRQLIRIGYRAALPVKTIADIVGSTPGSVKVIAHKMKLRHPITPSPGRRGRDASDEQMALFWRLAGPIVDAADTSRAAKEGK